MDKKSENRYFLIIKKNKILFTAFNSTEGSFSRREIYIEDHSINSIYYLLENFLEKNIFKIEKELKNFIKKINIIFESDSFFLAESSIKNNFKKSSLDHKKIKDMLIDIKNEFNKNSPGYKTIHMIINRYLINGNVYEVLPENIDCDNLVIQVNFICLEDQIVDNLKRIFSKYQISIDKILNYEYLQNLNNYNNENIVKLANDNINGLNVNEVFISRKILKNHSFFERFFNFFN